MDRSVYRYWKIGKLVTLDSGERSWIASIDKVKLYRDRHVPLMREKPSGEDIATREETTTAQAPIRNLGDIFDTCDDQGHYSQALSIHQFVVKIVAVNDAQTSCHDFVEAIGKKVEGLR